MKPARYRHNIVDVVLLDFLYSLSSQGLAIAVVGRMAEYLLVLQWFKYTRRTYK